MGVRGVVQSSVVGLEATTGMDDPPSPRPDTATEGPFFDFGGGGEEEPEATLSRLRQSLTVSEQRNAGLIIQLENKDREIKRLKAK